MTSRLQPVDIEKATGDTKTALDAVQARMGRVPNIMKLMGNSPAAVNGYLDFSAALSKGVLSPKLREQIAITCAETHTCEYCLSAHYARGKAIGMTEEELEDARLERSSDPKNDAALSLTRLLLNRKGDISDESFAPLKGILSDAEIAEIIAHVGLNVFSNYFNLFAKTEVDFPRIPTAFPA
jgi:AhpD family alkylhydroperoxidase